MNLFRNQSEEESTPSAGETTGGILSKSHHTMPPPREAYLHSGGADPAAGLSLARTIGYKTAEHLHHWDVYQSPRQAFMHAQLDYKLSEAEYYEFKEGVLGYFNQITKA